VFAKDFRRRSGTLDEAAVASLEGAAGILQVSSRSVVALTTRAEVRFPAPWALSTKTSSQLAIRRVALRVPPPLSGFDRQRTCTPSSRKEAYGYRRSDRLRS